jgi:hypothetical protein
MDGHQVISATKTEPDRMELHKHRQNSKTIWTEELLIAEYGRADKLFGHLIAFVRRLKGESVPAHLDEPFEPAPKKGKKTRPESSPEPDTLGAQLGVMWKSR